MFFLTIQWFIGFFVITGLTKQSDTIAYTPVSPLCTTCHFVCIWKTVCNVK